MTDTWRVLIHHWPEEIYILNGSLAGRLRQYMGSYISSLKSNFKGFLLQYFILFLYVILEKYLFKKK